MRLQVTGIERIVCHLPEFGLCKGALVLGDGEDDAWIEMKCRRHLELIST
jgi:hypothetical protein